MRLVALTDVSARSRGAASARDCRPTHHQPVRSLWRHHRGTRILQEFADRDLGDVDMFVFYVDRIVFRSAVPLPHGQSDRRV